PLLAGRAEEVQHEVVGDGDPAEVEGDRGGTFLLDAVQVVDVQPGQGQRLLGAQRHDLTDRADHGGLAHAEAAGDQDLDRVGCPAWVRCLGGGVGGGQVRRSLAAAGPGPGWYG